MVNDRKYFPELTGVRAISAYCVFNYHFNSITRERFGDVVFRLSQEMYLGVMVFYVLSGFLIYYRYGEEISRPSLAWLARYAKARFARIYPVYFLVLTFSYAYAGFPDLREALATYTLTQAFFLDLVHAGIPQAWTLTIEETFYFTAPLVFLLARRWSVLVPCGLFVALQWFLAYVDFWGNPYYGHAGHLLGRTLCGTFGCFACGIFLAQRMLVRDRDRPRSPWPWFTYSGIAATVALVYWVSRLGVVAETGLAAGQSAKGAGHPLGATLIFTAFPALVALTFYGLITERSLAQRVLGSRLLVLLGGSSYCFYLIHKGVFQQEVIFRHVSTNYFILFIVLNVVAIVIYQGLEKPVGRWIRSWGEVRAPRTAPPVMSKAAQGAVAGYASLVLLVAGVIGLPLLLQARGETAVLDRWFAEDGPYEAAEAILCLAAAAIVVYTAAWLWTTRPASGSAGTAGAGVVPLVVLSMMLVVMCGEELSWGQRLFGFATPAWLKGVNRQGEATLHNLEVFQTADTANRLQDAWLLVTLAYLGALPLAVGAIRPLGRLVERLGVPVPSLALSLAFIGTALVYLWKPLSSEALELAIDLLLFALACEVYIRNRKRFAARSHRGLVIAVLVPVLPLALALVLQPGARTLPIIESGQRLDEARRQAAQGDLAGATASYRRAIEVWPRNGAAHYELALVLLRRGQTAAAIRHLHEAVALDPDNAAAHYELGAQFAGAGQTIEAIGQMREAMRLRPDWPQPASHLAWILATHEDTSIRSGEEAVALAQRACELTHYNQPVSMDSLAAAYAETGRFDEAVATARKAFKAAIAADQIAMASQIRERQTLYESGKPFHQQPLNRAVQE